MDMKARFRLSPPLSLPQVFFEVEGVSSLDQGEHTLTVRLHDGNDQPLGAEQYSVFQVIGDAAAPPLDTRPLNQAPPSFGGHGRAPSWEAAEARRKSSCVMDASKTTAEGKHCISLAGTML